MTTQVPAYKQVGDEIIFEDGIRYTMKPKKPGDTRATPAEMWALITGADAIPASAEEIAEEQARRARKIDLSAVPDAHRFDLRK
jgi:hypothetical protein